MQIKNPVSVRARGWLYVAAIIFGSLSGVGVVILTVLGLLQWIAVLAAASSAFLTIASTLARSNLTVNSADMADTLEEADAVQEG